MGTRPGLDGDGGILLDEFPLLHPWVLWTNDTKNLSVAEELKSVSLKADLNYPRRSWRWGRHASREREKSDETDESKQAEKRANHEKLKFRTKIRFCTGKQFA
jgi:hypothetical protein